MATATKTTKLVFFSRMYLNIRWRCPSSVLVSSRLILLPAGLSLFHGEFSSPLFTWGRSRGPLNANDTVVDGVHILSHSPVATHGSLSGVVEVLDVLSLGLVSEKLQSVEVPVLSADVLVQQKWNRARPHDGTAESAGFDDVHPSVGSRAWGGEGSIGRSQNSTDGSHFLSRFFLVAKK